MKTTSQVSGTQAGDLDLSATGLGLIPPTGKSFANPEEPGEATIEGGKVTSIHIELRVLRVYLRTNIVHTLYSLFFVGFGAYQFTQTDEKITDFYHFHRGN